MLSRSLGPAADRAVHRGHALISAASRLIHRGAGDELTMQKVADESGLSLRVLYQHFGGKDDLLVALIEESQTVFAALMRRFVDRYTDPLDRFGAALSFATDRRLHSPDGFNRAMTRYATHVAMASPTDLGRARRPVFAFLAELVEDLRRAELIEVEDTEVATTCILLAYNAFQMNTYLGNSIGGPLPSGEDFVRFCLTGLGANIDDGWYARFQLTDEEAAPYRQEADRLSGGGSRGSRRSAD